MAARVLVIGGRGYYGSRVVEELRRLEGVEVAIGGRRGGPGEVRVDLTDASTFEALDGFEAVVNCSDTVRAAPDQAVAHVLESGGAWFEMGADAPAVERLLALDAAGAMGWAVIGVGTFPGLSTSMAAGAAAQAGGQPASLEVGVRMSPLSGAGDATVELMIATLQLPPIRFAGGQREEPERAAVVRLPFAGGRVATATCVALPDAPLVHRLHPSAEVASYMALVPGFLRHTYSLLIAALRLAGFLRRPALRLLAWQTWLMRAVLFRAIHPHSRADRDRRP